MFEATVIENHVHNDLQSLLVALVDESAVVGIGTEARIYTIVVGAGIAVICGPLTHIGRVVLENRSKPQRCNAQVVEVVQMLAQSFEVATVTQRVSRAVFLVSAHTLYL